MQEVFIIFSCSQAQGFEISTTAGCFGVHLQKLLWFLCGFFQKEI